VRLIILPIVELKDILFNYKLEQMCKYISAKGTLEGLHDPKELQKNSVLTDASSQKTSREWKVEWDHRVI
jgi:hypothetical protein